MPAVKDEGAAAEAVRAAVRVAVEAAMASALAWQREAEARIARAELDLAALQAAEQERARLAALPPVPPARVGPPPLPVEYATPPVATSVIERTAPVPEPPAPIPARPPPLPKIEDQRFDSSMLPDELNGGRRKRTLAWGATILLLLGLITLVALAIASQVRHGH